MKLHGKAKADFLRKMEAGRRRAKRGKPARAKRKKPARAKHAKRHAPHHHHHQHNEAPPMAKKRHHKRTSHKKKGRSHGHHKGGRAKTLLRSLTPTVDEAISAGTAGLYGFLEGQGAKDDKHFLRKVPVPIASIGRTGTIALGLWFVGALAKRRFIRSMASGVVDVAAYQLLRRPSPFGKAGEKDTEFTLGAYGGGACINDRRTPVLVDRHLRALDDDDDDDDDDDTDTDTDTDD